MDMNKALRLLEEADRLCKEANGKLRELESVGSKVKSVASRLENSFSQFEMTRRKVRDKQVGFLQILAEVTRWIPDPKQEEYRLADYSYDVGREEVYVRKSGTTHREKLDFYRFVESKFWSYGLLHEIITVIERGLTRLPGGWKRLLENIADLRKSSDELTKLVSKP